MMAPVSRNPHATRPGRFARLAPFAVPVMLALGPAAPSFAQILNEMNQDLFMPFPYEAKGAAAKGVLQDIAQKSGIPVITPDNISGTVDLSNERGSVRDALDLVTAQSNAVWWFDGAAVHVEPASALVSRLIGLEGITFGQLQSQMKAVGLDDPQYPLRASSNAEMVRVVAPEGYVTAVETLAKHLASQRPTAEAPRPGLPVILRGRSPSAAATPAAATSQ